MKSQLLVLVVLATAFFVHAVGFESEEPKLRNNLSDGSDFIRDLIGAITSKVAEPHIVGGYVVEPHSHPYQVGFVMRSMTGEESMCGGVLIHPEWILTAAHCVANKKAIGASLGAHDFSQIAPNRQVTPIRQCVLHHSFNPRVPDNDIALVKLPSPAVLNQYVNTIRLPSLSQKGSKLAGTTVEVTGWGRISDEEPIYSQLLRGAVTRVVATEECNQFYPIAIKEEIHICADGSQNKGTCHGDSGGPMILTEVDGKRTVVGITSFGSKEGCKKKIPTVFTRVDAYIDWISKITGISLRN